MNIREVERTLPDWLAGKKSCTGPEVLRQGQKYWRTLQELGKELHETLNTGWWGPSSGGAHLKEIGGGEVNGAGFLSQFLGPLAEIMAISC
ncbi:hypothetical protein AXG93_4316s1560 [Marchantia polymorpha subsp. ruderalis]|uniref:Uncharacterized protein n=1 Tax=Marchantia polymorpha subsp. ruderalis TaxID=1480154 RepID=A0A176VTB5_MARPO|nr:hypothetical protein AXG93_4316s1560 [Marchantia polymorpha subsp. ruderalis]